MNKKNILLNGKKIGLEHPPFIIAEMSGNHNQSLERALAIVEAVAETGAHAIKLQTYTADTMTLDIKEKEFVISDDNSLWNGNSLYDLYKQAYTPWEWHKPIFDKAKELGLVAFSTPFDVTAIDFLEGLDVPCYKIASFENTDVNLISKVAATGKPVIISSGMASLAELDEAISTLRKGGCEDIILLKCTSTYPASPQDTNILTIPHMRKLFNCEIGLSDHTLGLGVSVASVALGSTVIEKHFTLSRDDGGVDAAFSLEPEEMKALVRETDSAWQALGNIQYGPATKQEEKSLQFRRSLYLSKDICAGQRVTREHVRSIRPGMGLPPKYLETVLGMVVNCDIRKGTPLTWNLLK